MGVYDNPCDQTEDDWWVEEQMDKLKVDWEDAPPMHLYYWLLEAYPEVFKQWQSLYDIKRED